MKIAVLSILFLVTKISIIAQDSVDSYDMLLRNYYFAKEPVSIVAGISKGGTVIWKGASGYSNLEHLIPASDTAVYRIASISKFITAVAILQLVEKKRINLDEDIRVYVPSLPQKKWKITARRILQHTSGLRTYRDASEFDSKQRFNSTAEIVKYLSGDSLLYEPGSKYLYSTLSYTFLAAVIESVTGQSFGSYLRENIFKPAGMNKTTLEWQPELITSRADGYVRNAKREIENAPLADLSIKYAGGGIISTLNDLLKFGESLLNGKLLSPSFIDTLMKPLQLNNGETRDYGLGTGIWRDKAGRVFFGHSGSGTGFISQISINRDSGIVAVHLINNKDREQDNFANRLLARYFGDEPKTLKRDASSILVRIGIQKGWQDALNKYNSLLSDSALYYETGVPQLKSAGYDLLAENYIELSRQVFTLMANNYPNSAEAYVGLGDVYLKDNNKGLALKNFRIALRIDPSNSYAEKMVKELSKK